MPSDALETREEDRELEVEATFAHLDAREAARGRVMNARATTIQCADPTPTSNALRAAIMKTNLVGL
eukprot:2178535-Rhodomonas_salina.1